MKHLALTLAFFCSTFFISSAHADSQHWVVTFARNLTRPDGTPLLHNGLNVHLIESDYGASVSQVDEYYWYVLTFNPDGTCTVLSHLSGTKQPKTPIFTPLCPTATGQNGAAFRANFIDASGTSMVTQRLECVDGSAIHLVEPGINGPQVATGEWGNATPFEPKTIFHADYCPNGITR